MSDQVKEILNAVGALAETLGMLRDQLLKNGFTRQEAVELCRTYLSSALKNGKGNKDDQ